ncbi:hypothetical protein P8452_52292 [Trifolium repens]|nr:hypothetical protein P8452_52292 [Trifolium repens]
MTALLDPSKAFTISELGLKDAPSHASLAKVALGMTFKDDPVSTSTSDRMLSEHLTDMCKALLWSCPSEGNSLSLNPKYRLVVMFATTPSN